MTKNLSEAFYSEVFQWILSLSVPHGRLIVALNAPQGAGKTTLGQALAKLFTEVGVGFRALSIDDFYLTFEEQNQLGREFPETDYFQQRGYPGTHDIALGEKVLSELKLGNEVYIPRYDKSKNAGRGDRRPQSEWDLCDKSVKVILLEGWMLGFLPVKNGSPELEAANQKLPAYEEWYQYLDAFLRLKIEDFSWVVDWRVEAEEKRKASGEEGMSFEEITAYAKMFVPAYEQYSSTLNRFQQRFTDSKMLEIGKDRVPSPE